MSDSPERDAWSGVLLISRYKDGDNLYYIGLRNDGTGIMKKKMWGKYHTMGQTTVYSADFSFDRDTNPNLLPGKRWIGLRSVVQTQPNGSVLLQLWVDKTASGQWDLQMEAQDTYGGQDGPPLVAKGYSGIRTDFMDVQFEDFQLEEIN